MSLLVAYDGREHTKKALDYAIDEAVFKKTKLYVFSAIISKDQLDREDEVSKIENYMEEAKEMGRKKGADIETIIGSGAPAKGILEAAERFGCDTVVVGRAANKSSFDRAVLGSVSDAVVRDAKCVVIIVQ